jgi:predicted deacylase
MKILLLGSQHGNELLGDELYTHLTTHFSDLLPHITFIIGNPKAHAAGKRYIESDMNRSYDETLSTYEARRAAYIETYIENHAFDLVLDLHTTVCVQPPCLIIEGVYDENIAFLKASSIDKVILMQHNIVRLSLIGKAKQTLSIEVSNKDITSMFLNELCHDLRRYIMREAIAATKSVYPVTGLLLKTEVTSVQAKQLVNFSQSPLGFVPLLVGENSYKKNTHYLGFKASKETTIRL